MLPDSKTKIGSRGQKASASVVLKHSVSCTSAFGWNFDPTSISGGKHFLDSPGCHFVWH